MPKVQTRANSDGSFARIEDMTNRQRAAASRVARPVTPPNDTRTAVDARAASGDQGKGDHTAPLASIAAPAPSAAVVAPVEPVDDPNDTGLDAEDADLAERARKKISKKHRELRQAEALAGRLKGELEETETFSKSQYQRAQLAEEQAADLRRELGELKSGKTPPPAPETPKTLAKPDSADPKFRDGNGQFKLADYTEAVGEWSAKKALAEKDAADAETRRKADAERQEAARKDAEAKAVQRITEGKKRYADYDAVIEANPVRIHKAVGAFLTASENIADYSYYLAKHPDYAERLAVMNPLDAIAELGELRIRWKKPASGAADQTPPPARVSSAAPAPISVLPGNGAAGVESDPSKMTPAQLRQYDREKAVAKKMARLGH